jgi:hypothetical protein
MVQERFGDIRVDLIDDSGPPIQPSDGLWQTWQEVWDLEMPPGCVGCEESADNLRLHLEQMLMEMPNRLALLSFTRDTVISAFFRLSPEQFEARIQTVCDEFEPLDNAQCFLLDGGLHTLLVANARNTEASDGVALWRWLTQMVEDDPSWASHGP